MAHYNQLSEKSFLSYLVSLLVFECASGLFFWRIFDFRPVGTEDEPGKVPKSSAPANEIGSLR